MFHSFLVVAAVIGVSCLCTPAVESAASASIRGASSPTLTASPDVIDNVGKPASWEPTTTLSWEGAQEDDIIVLYWGVNTSYPYAMFFTGSASGSRQVKVLNFRQSFVYALIRLSMAAKTSVCHSSTDQRVCTEQESKNYAQKLANSSVIAWSNSVRFNDFNAPQHIHIAQGASVSEMRIMWNSGDNDDTPWVRLGTSPDSLESYFKGTTSTYNTSDMCGTPATNASNFIKVGTINDVLATGLKPSTKYYYQVSNGKSDGKWQTAVEYFITGPEKGTSDTVYSIVFGDIGISMPFTTIVADQKLNFSNYAPANESMVFLSKSVSNMNEPLNIVHIGDISYARGYAIFWEYFMDQVAPAASRVPYMVGIGNHEYDWPGQPFKPSWSDYGTDSGGECGVPYFNRFHMPVPQGKGNDNRNLYYSFDWGPIHYVIVSTETDFLEGSAQYKWTVDDLESVDRNQQPWIIFMGHRPMYTSTMSFSQDAEYIRQTYEPLFEKYHVDLALWGHVHQYERTAPISRNATEAPPGHGTVHVVIGNAGNTFQVPWEGSSTNFYPEPDWIVFRSLDYGIGGIRASKNKLEFAMHDDNRFLVHDSFTLYASDQKFRQY